MGLAAYGKYDKKLEEAFNKILSVGEDNYKFNTEFFLEGISLQHRLFSDKLIKLLGPDRKISEKITQKHMDIAYAAQKIFEMACKSLLKYIYNKHKTRNLCLSGGSSLNCVNEFCPVTNRLC